MSADARPIVVGVDGSPESLEAAALACERAAAEERAVVLVTVHPRSERAGEALADIARRRRLRRDEAARLLAETVGPLQARWPGVDIATRILEGDTVDELARAGRDAALIVVGSRGRGGVAGLVLGSTSRRLLATAAVPVTVTR